MSFIVIRLDSFNLIIFFFVEPDVIASTKLAHSKTTDSLISSGPIAPPRKKKKARKMSSSSSEQFNLNEGLPLPPIDHHHHPHDVKLTVKLPSNDIEVRLKHSQLWRLGTFENRSQD